MLEKAGYSVVQAENGYRAIELAARERFDLILMDIQMPGLDGLATTAELRRQMVDAPATPIIALTANVMSDRIDASKPQVWTTISLSRSNVRLSCQRSSSGYRPSPLPPSKTRL